MMNTTMPDGRVDCPTTPLCCVDGRWLQRMARCEGRLMPPWSLARVRREAYLLVINIVTGPAAGQQITADVDDLRCWQPRPFIELDARQWETFRRAPVLLPPLPSERLVSDNVDPVFHDISQVRTPADRVAIGPHMETMEDVHASDRARCAYIERYDAHVAGRFFTHDPPPRRSVNQSQTEFLREIHGEPWKPAAVPESESGTGRCRGIRIRER